MPELKFPTSTPSSRLDTRSQTSGERKPVSKPRPHVLFVSPAHDDHHALGRILKDSCWRLSAATDCVDAIARHARDRVAIVVCESTLPSGSWRDLLRHISDCPEPPVLIVTSRLADEYLWAEVLNLGGYDVLAKHSTSRRYFGCWQAPGAKSHSVAVEWRPSVRSSRDRHGTRRYL